MSRKTTRNEEKAPASTEETGRFFLPSDARWGGYINVKLDDAQRENFKEVYEGEPNYGASIIDDALGEGMKLACVYDRANAVYIVSFTGRLVSNSNERYCVTSRAGTLHQALAVAAHKHELLDGDYGQLKADGTNPAWD